MHDIRALLTKYSPQFGTAAEPRAASEIDIHCLERTYSDGVDLVRCAGPGRMRCTRDHRALMPEAIELSREVECQALNARVEAREELVRD